MTKDEIKAKHKDWSINEINKVRKQMEGMLLTKPQLRNLNQDKYDIQLGIWKSEFMRLKDEITRIYVDWNKGVDFIY